MKVKIVISVNPDFILIGLLFYSIEINKQKSVLVLYNASCLVMTESRSVRQLFFHGTHPAWVNMSLALEECWWSAAIPVKGFIQTSPNIPSRGQEQERETEQLSDWNPADPARHPWPAQECSSWLWPGSERSFPLIPPSFRSESQVSLSLCYQAWTCSSTSGASESLLAENEKLNASMWERESEEDINTERKTNREFKMKFMNVFV